MLSAYLFALNVIQQPLVEARTVALSTLVVLGLYFVLVLEARRPAGAGSVGMLCTGCSSPASWPCSPSSRRAISSSCLVGFWGIVGVVGGAGLAIAGLALSDARFVPEQIRRVRTR